MLVKKILKEIPIQEVLIKEHRKSNKMIEHINAYTIEDKHCGHILVVDFFDQENEIIKRFYCDGKKGITLNSNGSWTSGLIDSERYNFEYVESEDNKKIVLSYLDKGNWHSNSINAINYFLSDISREKRQIYQENKINRMMDHLDMYPGDPKDLGKYCEEYVFSKRYILFEKVDKIKTYSCRCLHCGRKFTYKQALKHKGSLECPKCGSNCTAIASRYIGSIKDKEKICIVNKVENSLITVWKKIERTYSEKGKPKYHTEAYFYDVLIDNCKRYYYHYVTSWWTRGFTKINYSNVGDNAFVYANNMKQIYKDGINPQGLNLDRIRYAGKIDFISLINASAKTDTAKSLYKIGLYKLAGDAGVLPSGKTFQEVTGLNKCYLAPLKKYNINFTCLRILQLTDVYLTEDMIRKIVYLEEKRGGYHSAIESFKKISKYMSFTKTVNYFYKQLVLHPKKSFATLVDLYTDYIDMTNQLNKGAKKEKRIDTTSTMFNYPRSLVQAHDGTSAKLRLKKNKKMDKQIKAVASQLKRSYLFETQDLIIEYPNSTEDFIYEGATLKHCVGNNSHYRDAYAEKKEITIFIRKKENPEKPYYTATFHTKDFKLKECYGISHKTAPNIIQKFLIEYAKYMKEKMLNQVVNSKVA